MANGKAVAVAVGVLGALGLAVLLATEAKADPAKPKGGGARTGPSASDCAGYGDQLSALLNQKVNIKGQMTELDAELMAAYTNGADQATVGVLLAAKTNLTNQTNAINAQMATIQALAKDCP